MLNAESGRRGNPSPPPGSRFSIAHAAFSISLPPMHVESREDRWGHRRRRLRRHGRRAYIRSAYSLPSLATLGNLICGFGAMYVATLTREMGEKSPDPLTQWFYKYHFFVSA